MYGNILFRWAFYRVLGLRDTGKFINVMKEKIRRSNRRKYLTTATVSVTNDTQIDSGVEPMDAGSQTCPTWYSTRIFKGYEEYPTDKRFRDPEYWYGCRETFLTPIIPIPICAEEIVIKLGNDKSAYDACFSKYGRMHSMLDHKDEYSHVVWDECNVNFVKCDILYKNDPLLSVYYDK